MLTIEDINSPYTYVGYWDQLVEQYPNQQGYLSNVLFNDFAAETDFIGLVYGANLNIRGLSASDYDADVTNLNNIGFTAKYVPIPFFKNSKLMTEKRRRDIQRALTNNPAQGVQQGVVQTQLQDVNQLYYDAMFTRERMAMEVLTTGKVTYGDNVSTIDFGIPKNHFIKAATPWGTKDSSPMQDLIYQAQHILDENSTVIKYAIMNTKTWIKLQHSGDVLNSLSINRTDTNITFNPNQVTDLMTANTGIRPLIYNKQDGAGNKLIPDDTVLLIPDIANGGLGRMAYTATPEATGLAGMAGVNAQVSTTGNGVSLTTSHNVDPVGMMYKVSEQVLPVFDKAHNTLVMDVSGADVTWGNFQDLDNANGQNPNDPSMPKKSSSSKDNSTTNNTGSTNNGSTNNDSSNTGSSSKGGSSK